MFLNLKILIQKTFIQYRKFYFSFLDFINCNDIQTDPLLWIIKKGNKRLRNLKGSIIPNLIKNTVHNQ